jgi:hypothetical protein
MGLLTPAVGFLAEAADRSCRLQHTNISSAFQTTLTLLYQSHALRFTINASKPLSSITLRNTMRLNNTLLYGPYNEVEYETVAFSKRHVLGLTNADSDRKWLISLN